MFKIEYLVFEFQKIVQNIYFNWISLYSCTSVYTKLLLMSSSWAFSSNLKKNIVTLWFYYAICSTIIIDACSFHYRFCRIQAATALWRIPMLPGVILTETSRTFYEAANKTMLWPFTQPRRSPRPKALTWRPHPRPPTPRQRQQHRRRLRRPRRRRRIRCKRQQPRLRIAVPHLRLRLLCFFDAR